jgi:putative Holliday junction resolvase
MRYLAPAAFVKYLARFQPPQGGKIAAFDVGRKRIGVAMTDESRTVVVPMTTMERERSGDIAQLSKQVQAFVNETGCVGLVVGLPLKDGQATEMANEIVELMLQVDCHKQAKEKGDETSPPPSPLPFTLWSEVGSTMKAREIIKQASSKRSVYAKRKDEVAAAVILKRFMFHNQDLQ